MAAITERYRRTDRIGEGTYGIVYRAEDRATSEVVALKRIRLEAEENGVPCTAMREAAVLMELKHPNVVRLKEVDYGADDLYLVFEYMQQDLKRYMDSVSPLPLSSTLVKSYVYQILRALAYCHSKRIVHRDLKPQNLLIDGAGQIKLADFGLARGFSMPIRPYTHEVVTLWYRAPEVLLGCKWYSTPIDIWATGAIFAEMIMNRPLWPGDAEIDQLYKIFQCMGTPDDESWPGVATLPDYRPIFPNWRKKAFSEVIRNAEPLALDLLEKMLVYEPNRRISAREALQHPYFDDIRISDEFDEPPALQSLQSSAFNTPPSNPKSADPSQRLLNVLQGRDPDCPPASGDTSADGEQSCTAAGSSGMEDAVQAKILRELAAELLGEPFVEEAAAVVDDDDAGGDDDEKDAAAAADFDATLSHAQGDRVGGDGDAAVDQEHEVLVRAVQPPHQGSFPFAGAPVGRDVATAPAARHAPAYSMHMPPFASQYAGTGAPMYYGNLYNGYADPRTARTGSGMEAAFAHPAPVSNATWASGAPPSYAPFGPAKVFHTLPSVDHRYATPGDRPVSAQPCSAGSVQSVSELSTMLGQGMPGIGSHHPALQC